ncbi:MAG: DUF6508 domain-containing protein [Ardenticatenia bacterium]|nr:DUF6508 domain-containing protein [Ardenticatenia bacterium]
MKQKSITRERIDELLRFLPLFDVPGKSFIERWAGGEQKEGVITMPYPVSPPEVQEFFRLAGSPWWCDDDYEPAVAAKMLADDTLIAEASLDHIKTMLTYCVRGERFCDGHWDEMLRSGKVVQLLRGLEQLRETVT